MTGWREYRVIRADGSPAMRTERELSFMQREVEFCDWRWPELGPHSVEVRHVEVGAWGPLSLFDGSDT